MTVAPPPPARRMRFAVVLAAVTLLLGGCVYLRLLELKRQLADFDRHFTLQTTAGLRLNFLQPVLLADDVRWIGFFPTTVRTVGRAEQWHLRWVKQPTAGVRERNNFEIVFDLTFTEGKLTALTIPESYFGFVSKDVVIAAIKSLGGAAVDQKQRRAQGSVVLASDAERRAWPNRKLLTALLGLPTEEQVEDGHVTARYLCQPTAPDGKGKELDIRLVFDARTEMLVQTTTRLPFGRVDLKFDPPAATPPPAP